MSIRVMNWVWDYSPAKGTELLLLLAIADAANDDGTNAFPSITTLARKTRLDSRTVRRIVRKLTAEGHIEVDERGGRESNRYSVRMEERFSTPLTDCHPWQNDTPGTGATPPLTQLCHPTPDTATPPDPSYTRPRPSTVEEGGEGSTKAGAVLDRLGAQWPLTPRQRRHLIPKVERAFSAGWPPERLAEYLAANPGGVKAPAAVLSTRLDDLPTAPRERENPDRPSWCGSCLESTRMVEDGEGRPSRCQIGRAHV